MDSSDSSKISGNENLSEPIPFDDDTDKPIPFDDEDTIPADVSHSPLSLGGSGTVREPKIQVPRPVAKKETEKVVSAERITGVRTFFTKLHPGAMEFLDGQITNWLQENPGVSIKRTNTATGEVTGKKTEPNLIVTVWY